MEDLFKKIKIGFFVFLVFIIFSQGAMAASVYGALYEVGNLVGEDGINRESILTYYPSEDGFIAITTNDNGLEWWTSDELGINWELTEVNPLDEYSCNQPGRHSLVTYNDEVYFSAFCGSPGAGKIFKLTGRESIELLHTNTISFGEDETVSYPTASVLGDSLYMFFNGGFTSFDGTSWQDITNTTGQVEGVPLEVSSEQDGFIYLAQTSGEVQTFDGSVYATIGEGYLENLESGLNSNLPAIEVFNDAVYVGNQDMKNGASLFKYDGTDWQIIADLDADDIIINKMQLSDEIDGSNYLVFYTANGDTGTNIYAIDEDDNVIQLTDSGLGGVDPENNQEVVSVVNRTVDDNGTDKQIMLFGTQNSEDQTKIFALNLDSDLAIDADTSNVLSTALSKKKATTKKGKVFKYKIKKAQIEAGAVYSLWINNSKISQKKAAKKKAITLKYKKAKNKKLGKSFNVKVGVRHVYGAGSDQKKASNIIKGNKLKVTVRKK